MSSCAFPPANTVIARMRLPFPDPDLVARLIRESMVRRAGRVLAAVNGAGDLQAAIFTVWDHHTEYYFMSTRRPTSANGAVSMLVWEAMQHAAQAGLRFDMDGLHVKKGAVQTCCSPPDLVAACRLATW